MAGGISVQPCCCPEVPTEGPECDVCIGGNSNSSYIIEDDNTRDWQGCGLLPSVFPDCNNIFKGKQFVLDETDQSEILSIGSGCGLFVHPSHCGLWKSVIIDHPTDNTCSNIVSTFFLMQFYEENDFILGQVFRIEIFIININNLGNCNSEFSWTKAFEIFPVDCNFSNEEIEEQFGGQFNGPCTPIQTIDPHKLLLSAA